MLYLTPGTGTIMEWIFFWESASRVVPASVNYAREGRENQLFTVFSSPFSRGSAGT